jgi:hypothetical protein
MQFHIQGSSLIFIYLFIYSYFSPALPYFLLLFFLSFLHIFPPIDLSVFLSICFLCSSVLESHIKQDVTLWLDVFFFSITPKKLQIAVHVLKKRIDRFL